MQGGEELALNLNPRSAVHPVSLNALLAIHPTIPAGQISRIQSQQGPSASEMFMEQFNMQPGMEGLALLKIISDKSLQNLE